MHFSIPDTEEFSNAEKSHTNFKIYINGVYHCATRYSELLAFYEQLKTEYGATILLPSFPPKKILSLNAGQLEERRYFLEKFIQGISQDPVIGVSTAFNDFLAKAQKESRNVTVEKISLVIWLMNKKKLCLTIENTAKTEDVLETFAKEIGLQDDLTYYFGLYLMCRDSEHTVSIIRKLQDFESPFLSLQEANKINENWICVRKSYWDSELDDDLLDDRIALNLLYVQALADVHHGWSSPNDGQKEQLQELQTRNSKRELLSFARTLPGYGCLPFRRCKCDWPKPGISVDIVAACKELLFHLHLPKGEVKEVPFRVVRIRCWRITTSAPSAQTDTESQGAPTRPSNEISFEYLVAKDTLKWVTVNSDQAVLLSMTLQSMVDELLLKKEGRRLKRPMDRQRARQGGGTPLITKPTTWVAAAEAIGRITKRGAGGRRAGPVETENESFVPTTEHIGDDDL